MAGFYPHLIQLTLTYLLTYITDRPIKWSTTNVTLPRKCESVKVQRIQLHKFPGTNTKLRTSSGHPIPQCISIY